MLLIVTAHVNRRIISSADGQLNLVVDPDHGSDKAQVSLLSSTPVGGSSWLLSSAATAVDS